MGFFDTEKGADEYLKMAEGYDGAELIRILQKSQSKSNFLTLQISQLDFNDFCYW